MTHTQEAVRVLAVCAFRDLLIFVLLLPIHSSVCVFFPFGVLAVASSLSCCCTSIGKSVCSSLSLFTSLIPPALQAMDDDSSPSMSSNSPLPNDSVAVPPAHSEDPSCDDSADMSSEDLEVASFDDPDAVAGSSAERRAS
ncbi:hypothetical protein BKA82DRAFT_28901 [Pisolithus tinctorius]|uniref:Uncharacterized protein n=1 Tax=Pisolithus tinctorius Marx 270 TaxID=870435 RepID=A0A0C3P1F6_PISTI|nr:hypothetical protein BKA82DRAFT_28901 [Pisolithus tinctorius]KIO01174.1 hypothetical protein M404DRAFT_28901 [Pisolithus tinctorius Marx 270]